MNREVGGGLMGAIQCASDYIEIGWKIHPLHTIHGGRCTCRKCMNCRSPGKHPRTRTGVKQATTDTSIISKWQDRWPEANIGVATGKESGIVVIDVDAGKGGLESFSKLVKDYGSNIGDTLIADTGGGGFHLVFQDPNADIGNNQGKLGQGLDIRGDGGYIVAAPSLHISGKSYKWRDGLYRPERMPDALLGALLECQLKPSHSASLPAKIPAGQRNDALFRFAASLRGHGMEDREILSELAQVNANRCHPPLADSEINSIARSASTYGKGAYGLLNLYRRQIVESNALSGITKLILHTIAFHADSHTLVAFPSQETIAAESSVARKTVINHVQIAQSLGWLSLNRRSRRNSKQGWLYEYKLTFPASIDGCS